MPSREQTARLWWAVPAAAVLLLLTLTMVFGKPPETHGPGNSYDASNKGFRAAYLLLEGLGFPVARSKRPTAGGPVRWVLFPEMHDKDRDADVLADWVHSGGVLLLADDSTTFAKHLGMKLQIHKLDVEPVDTEPARRVAGVGKLAGGRTWVDWPKHEGRVWAWAGKRSAVTIYRQGKGEVWLVNRPDLITNRLLKEADNAILVTRMAEEQLRERPGDLAIDEYVHGMRDRAGVSELLFEPPTVWVTAQCLLLAAVALWHFVPRFGAMRFIPPTRRRSKEEFLDAMASLLERRGDYPHAYASARSELIHEIERDLGVPAQVKPEELLEEVKRRRPAGAAALQRLLARNACPPGAGRANFVGALNDLEKTRDEYFRRSPRR